MALLGTDTVLPGTDMVPRRSSWQSRLMDAVGRGLVARWTVWGLFRGALNLYGLRGPAASVGGLVYDYL